MWNSKKVKQLESELKEANQRIYDYTKSSQLIVSILQDIQGKIDPKPVVVKNYTIEAKALAREISQMHRKSSCGTGGCGIHYLVPQSFIDQILKSK